VAEAGDDTRFVEQLVKLPDPPRPDRVGAGGDAGGGGALAGADDAQPEPVEPLAEVGFQVEEAGRDAIDPDRR
jgi:hypothetical protein